MKIFIKSTLILLAIFCIGFNTETTLAQGHQGIYVKYKMALDTTDGSKEVYYVDGNTRIESVYYVNRNKDLPKMKTLSIKDSTNTEYLIDETNKTYHEYSNKIMNEITKNYEYEIIVLGKEKVDNYNCIHVKIVYKSNHTVQEEMWTSKDVMDYSLFKNMSYEYFGSSNMFKALEAKGADGFIVKTLRGKNTLDLVKAEKRDMDMSMFSLQGFTKLANPFYKNIQK